MPGPRGLAIPALARVGFGALQAAAPSLAARLAEMWFFTPPRARLTSEIAAWLRTGRRFTLRVDGRAVVGWAWGSGPAVYLLHGWGSRGGWLRPFAEPLIEAGYKVVTFDAPGHGASGRGLSSVPEFARALRAATERHGPAQAVIAHSLGGSAAALAAQWGLVAQRIVLLAPSANPAVLGELFATAVGLRPDVITRLRANSERRLRFRWEELDVCAAAAHVSIPLLVVHDRDDHVMPFAEGAAIAASWTGARLHRTSGLGHRGVLRDPGVVAEVLRFVADDDSVAVPWGQQAELEQELFDREARWH